MKGVYQPHFIAFLNAKKDDPAKRSCLAGSS